MKTVRWGLFGVLCFLFLYWLVMGSPSFENCISQGQTADTEEALQKIITNLLLYRGCVGPFLYANETTITALSTAVIAIFTAILGGFTVVLAGATRTAATAAKKASETAERALVAVERPILVVSILEKFYAVAVKPKFSINIENAGRQVANTNGITVSLVIQKDSNFPSATAIDAVDGSTCTTIPVVGQFVIKPAASISISCQRQGPITADQVDGITNGTLYAFFTVGIIYNDSVGNDRVTDWVALLRPSGQFVQIFSADHVNKTLLTPEEQEQNQRALIDTILGIERERGYPFPDK
jgi:hypothetical protein